MKSCLSIALAAVLSLAVSPSFAEDTAEATKVTEAKPAAAKPAKKDPKRNHRKGTVHGRTRTRNAGVVNVTHRETPQKASQKESRTQSSSKPAARPEKKSDAKHPPSVEAHPLSLSEHEHGEPAAFVDGPLWAADSHEDLATTVVRAVRGVQRVRAQESAKAEQAKKSGKQEIEVGLEKTGPKANAKSDGKADAKTDAKAEAKGESKIDAKAESDCPRVSVEVFRGPEVQSLVLSRCESDAQSVSRLSAILRPMTGTLADLKHKSSKVDKGLMARIAQVADHFARPGEPVRMSVISGIRPSSQGSQHATGRAVDLRIDGVPNEKLIDFCKSLTDTGCGYYPNSSFVHVDVREPGTGHLYWIDASGPGQAPRYVTAWPEEPNEPRASAASPSPVQ